MSARLAKLIVGSACIVQDVLGPGLAISAYRECLYYELKKSNFKVTKNVAVPIVYKEIKIEESHIIDLVLEDKMIIDIRVVESLSDFHSDQILNYMKLGGYPYGILINFHSTDIMIKRLENTSLLDL